MPVEVKKYTCKHRCGRKAVNNINAVAAHENTCWNNPDNLTCKTCKNEIYVNEDGKTYRGCKIASICAVMDEMREEMMGDNMRHVRPVYNCPWHNIYTTNEEMNTAGYRFANELKSEIKESYSTIHFPFHNKSKKLVEELNNNLPF